MLDKNLFIQNLKSVYTVLQELKVIEKQVIDILDNIDVSVDEKLSVIHNEIEQLELEYSSLLEKVTSVEPVDKSTLTRTTIDVTTLTVSTQYSTVRYLPNFSQYKNKTLRIKLTPTYTTGQNITIKVSDFLNQPDAYAVIYKTPLYNTTFFSNLSSTYNTVMDITTGNLTATQNYLTIDVLFINGIYYINSYLEN